MEAFFLLAFFSCLSLTNSAELGPFNSYFLDTYRQSWLLDLCFFESSPTSLGVLKLLEGTQTIQVNSDKMSCIQVLSFHHTSSMYPIAPPPLSLSPPPSSIELAKLWPDLNQRKSEDLEHKSLNFCHGLKPTEKPKVFDLLCSQ